VLINLREHLRANGFGDRGATPTIEVVSRGLHLLESILIGQDFSKNTQHEFDLLYSGLEKYIEELRNEVRELDEKLQSPI
ncbi:MAG TPA: hypothetical protein VMJ31_05090, partial [Methylocystis sp.]|nr:hypothetical protein [Methylocystis sp.]